MVLFGRARGSFEAPAAHPNAHPRDTFNTHTQHNTQRKDTSFTVSYVEKNIAAPGADPAAAANKPLYTPRNPPDR